MKKIYLLLIAGSAATTSCHVFSETEVSTELPQNPWQFSLGAGWPLTDTDASAVNHALRQAGESQLRVSDISQRPGFSLWAGYQWSAHYRLEAGYLNFGPASGHLSGFVNNPQTASQILTDQFPLSAQGIAFTIKPSYNLSDSLSVYARGGPFFNKSEISAGQLAEKTVRGMDLLLGVGAQWMFSQSWGIGMDWNRGLIESRQTDLITFNIVYMPE
ncbi:OmpA-like transmembrane domain protein [Vibrio aerogenes CECT 7868]|uniref:OmpA-like transmembrane domain protein n=1 Tax=Vibrio aerogenes CECT 7868 TaxID=1216006 RepID=A0A1M5UTA8_9VIBR|nr:outer membrane beta-barrel protein [Vibrio aerogenes]SHH66166.1 OmpA-like transmembrane domain protein [Vibrio aerogenes CECT 7868]